MYLPPSSSSSDSTTSSDDSSSLSDDDEIGSASNSTEYSWSSSNENDDDDESTESSGDMSGEEEEEDFDESEGQLNGAVLQASQLNNEEEDDEINDIDGQSMIVPAVSSTSNAGDSTHYVDILDTMSSSSHGGEEGRSAIYAINQQELIRSDVPQTNNSPARVQEQSNGRTKNSISAQKSSSRFFS